MDRLIRLFTGKESAESAQKRSKKRESKKHSQRVRAREKELRRAQDSNATRKTKFFWGSPGQTFENNVRGPGEGVWLPYDQTGR